MMSTQYRIVEIFETLQGEGYNTGMPSIFIRFGKCNLACSWCDTDYHRFSWQSLEAILTQVQQYSAKNIIITGGEPAIQPNIELLLTALKELGYFLAIESNGLQNIPAQIDYIAVSPKAHYWQKYQSQHIHYANEVRVVVDDNVHEFCEWVENNITAERYYLSPLDNGESNNLLATMTLLGVLNERANKPHWQLSLQTHKLVGIE